MKAKELARLLLENPDDNVYVCQTMNFNSLACQPCLPVSFKERTYLLMDKEGPLGFDIPQEVLDERWQQSQ